MYSDYVFPTPVGVNRRLQLIIITLSSIPHTRGGEPVRQLGGHWGRYVFPTEIDVDTVMGVMVFPTPVGVNRGCEATRGRLSGIPHTRGGEPVRTSWV